MNTPPPILDKIFAHPRLRDIDTHTLYSTYSTADAITQINTLLGTPCAPVPQTSLEITTIPPEGILISQPGDYILKPQTSSSLQWQPNASSTAAIVIASNDVTLDMNGSTLSAQIQDNSQHLTGIYIHDASDVIIKNGTLTDMSLYGIRAERVTALTLDTITISGMFFDNLNIRNLCPSGILINDATDVTLTQCCVQYMYITADSSAGIQLLNTHQGTVTECHVSHLTNNDGSVQGYSYILSEAITTSQCDAQHLQSHFNGNIRTLGHTVLGFIPLFCYDLTFETCSTTAITGCSDDCHGMSVFLDAKVTVTNFTATSVTDGVTPTQTGAKATGLEVYGIDITLNHCNVEGIKAINPQDKQSTGFSVWGVDITLNDCNASNVIVCDALGNENPQLGFGTGFGWAPDPRVPFCSFGAYGVLYQNCQASECQVAFDTWFHVDSNWENIAYHNCGIDILVQPNATRTLSADPASECNPPISVVITNIAVGNNYPGAVEANL